MSKYKGSVLVVDDDQDVLYTARLILKQKFSNVQVEVNPQNIPKHLRNHSPDVILLDMNFAQGATSGNEGLFWMREILKQDPEASIVMNTAYGDINLAVEAMKEGAIDFIVKPWEQEKLLTTLSNVYQLARSKREVVNLKNRQSVLQSDLNQGFEDFIFASESMKSLLATIDKVADTDANVLILGENGTGKELVARALHGRSSRNRKPFIKVDLGALPSTLFESELFGHIKGAFTDAKTDRPGRFEVAEDGSLFLDEIGNLPVDLQTKLLSALQNREFYKIGGTTPSSFQARLISATNMDLYGMIEDREFRQDLLYRINTVEIRVPALRERPEDIGPIADHYLKIYSQKYRKGDLSIPASTLKKLEGHEWPGNVRELQHAVERAVIMGSGKLLSPSEFLLPQGQRKSVTTDTLNKKEVERDIIQRAIAKHQGNLSKASETLGMGRSTLYRKMKKYGL